MGKRERNRNSERTREREAQRERSAGDGYRWMVERRSEARGGEDGDTMVAED